MTTYSFGDIVLVPFPFTDQSSVKRRPAVVVSSGEYNRHRPDIILMPVTSQVRLAAFYSDMTVSQCEKAGLIKPSVIKPIFTTIEKDLVIRRLGQLSKEDRGSLKKILQKILGE